jgi:hypothetical protein
MSSFVGFRSRRISLAERSRSSFAPVVFSYLRAGEDLPPPFGDADNDCQWEVQTNEGWIPYWGSQA